MSEEIKIEGLAIAPGVLETIVTLAAESVEGVAQVCSAGLAGLVRKSGTKGPGRAVDVSLTEEGSVMTVLHLKVTYGHPLRGVARLVQTAISDALSSQVGLKTASVDVYIDGIEFPA